MPQGHLLTKEIYELTKNLHALKMSYEEIHSCPKGCIYLEKNMTKENIASIANPLGSLRLMLAMAIRGGLGFPKRSCGIFLSCRGSNGFS
jgi:hypothetical protein